MDCLELSIRQQVLSDLAALDHETEDALTSVQELIQSGTVLPEEMQDSDVDNAAQGEIGPRIFMSEARTHCNIAFGEHVANLSEGHVRSQEGALITPLLDILHDAPHVDYDQCLSWDGNASSPRVRSQRSRRFAEWALPDQLVYTTVSALLRICFVNEDHTGLVINAILGFISQVIEKLRVSNRMCMPG
ncbi:hypothetical protein PISMIDRAFT_130324 [Pisolithus microcarpus 441]|uniref:Unplaced genomic scaffold scaffold_1, whole genome shotgun sequence n=1 Tax=Pisolithus microcarpus 441 TaxID=765257 RepID=A0A0C9ZNZ1_9AGAM|nr:hypothetical protein PISMIDRAFT_130324 [Pisolithus microcarpus 441]